MLDIIRYEVCSKNSTFNSFGNVLDLRHWGTKAIKIAYSEGAKPHNYLSDTIDKVSEAHSIVLPGYARMSVCSLRKTLVTLML